MKQNDNSMAIIILCSHLCVGKDVKPYSPKEWSDFANDLMKRKIQPCDVLNFTEDDFKKTLLLGEQQIARLDKLIARSGSIAFELQKLNNIGINIITRADANYPKLLKKNIGNTCHPLFYCVGNMDLVNRKLLGFVGSRSVNENDILFTKTMVQQAVTKGFAIVSGGAKGIDSIAREEALHNDGVVVEFICDSLIKKIKDTSIINAIRDERLLLLSVTKPDAGFNVGIAMMRNKYIYASSSGTIIVKADLEKGGTWAGAIDNLKMKWTKTFCWNNKKYSGNMELINRGVIPIDENWDIDFDILPTKDAKYSEQMSIFDYT